MKSDRNPYYNFILILKYDYFLRARIFCFYCLIHNLKFLNIHINVYFQIYLKEKVLIGYKKDSKGLSRGNDLFFVDIVSKTFFLDH